ncbi:hypothetical protein NUW58_g6191 [Xylaria curta]|uniref:Uncharacterized protein n=1 Tax=Xylaria curta TaxID=42375 RepID=A0ACC1NZD6_9PEZI|nr:hypothetical protein NUW58_g6191 [Xylaria curta]
MEQYMRLFDQFFFFGALVNKIRPRVVLKFWTHFHNLDEIRPFNSPSLPWGFTRDRYVRGYGPIAEIHIAGELFFGGPVPLWFFLETLLHEMVHAYINLYLCRCAGCYANMLDTYGVTGHGRTFLMLIDTIDQTVKTWNAGLAGVMTGKIVAGQPYDEIKLLYEKEKRIVQGRNAAHTRKPPSQPDETRSPQAPADATRGKKRRTSARAQAPWNMLKPLEETEPGAQVYMTGAQTGATKVEQSKLDQTCETVQALLAKKKTGAKLRFRWSISYKGKSQNAT